MMNCRPAEPLPADLEEFFNGSGDEGVVYVSFGSALQASKMPESKRLAIVKALGTKLKIDLFQILLLKDTEGPKSIHNF